MTSEDERRVFVLLDKKSNQNTLAGHVAYWGDFNVPMGCYSLPGLVYSQVDALKDEYLSWIHELGEYRVCGRRLREYLRLTDGLSFWWMTIIADKHVMRSPQIYDILRLRALERLYLSTGCRIFILQSDNRQLHRILSEWCRRMGHSYRWERQSHLQEKIDLRGFFRKLPHPLQALGSLIRRIWSRYRHVRSGTAIPQTGRQATVVSYFPNFDRDAAARGVYRSHYFTKLHDLLDREKWCINWIWVFSGDEFTFPEAMSVRDRFNKNHKNRYYFIEEFMTIRTLLRALFLYCRLVVRGVSLKAVRRSFILPGSSINFWPILSWEWKSSLFGTAAIDNALLTALSRSIANKLPRQDWGLYLWENQPWERAFISSWKQHGHGRIIGFQHTTVSYLYLRYFEDKRSYALATDPPPLPDLLAVGGAAALELFLRAGFPEERLVPVEALRYLYMNDAVKRLSNRKKRLKRILLAVTGYRPEVTAEELRLLAAAASMGGLETYDEVWVKPHPFCPVESILSAVAPGLEAKIVSDPLEELWPHATTVYASNSTTAAIEAAMAKLPVAIHLHSRSLNISPLFGLADVDFVSRPEELANFLKEPRKISIRPDFLYLDSNMPRWRRLLTPDKEHTVRKKGTGH
ncbi:MAG: hypothetical protein JRF53_08040 [Deltaproteobacteria bacterium]|nr:hypothetical protein [Deltaproteobacteria bacterium]